MVTIIQHIIIGISLWQRIADLPYCGRREREPVKRSYPPCFVRVLYSMSGVAVK